MGAFGAYILGCEGPALLPAEAAFFAEANPFGFILFARNIETPEQVRRLTNDLRAAVGRDAPVLIDQEGGRVQRMTPPHWRQWLPPLDEVRRAGPGAARAMFLRSRIIADELRAVGIDVNCAPLADIASDTTHPILRNRCYSEDPVEVIEVAGAVAAGLMKGGVLPVVKHIPGHGRAKVDSHLEVPRVSASLNRLKYNDFMAFEPFADLPMGMTAHLVFEAIDPDLPATLSPAMNALIRERIGFSGLLMTDDISMQALSGSVEARGRAALDAGCDVVLHCNGNLAEMQAIARDCATMGAASQARAERALAARQPAEPADISALEAEHRALLDGKGVKGQGDG